MAGVKNNFFQVELIAFSPFCRPLSPLFLAVGHRRHVVALTMRRRGRRKKKRKSMVMELVPTLSSQRHYGANSLEHERERKRERR